MKITKTLVKEFEADQKQYNTETALYNVLWDLASEIMRDIGVKIINSADRSDIDVLRLLRRRDITDT